MYTISYAILHINIMSFHLHSTTVGLVSLSTLFKTTKLLRQSRSPSPSLSEDSGVAVLTTVLTPLLPEDQG